MPPKSAKPVFKTSSPFTETHWPKLSSVDRDNILDLLCSLLQPLGDHRRQYVTPSKGRKRKRNSKSKPEGTSDTAPPPPPDIGAHVLVGLNSVTRHLEALAARNAPSSLPAAKNEAGKEQKGAEPSCSASSTSSSQPLTPLSLVLIPHPNPPSSFPHAHIPTLVHLSNLKDPSNTTTTSTTSPPLQPTRLLALPSHTESALSTTLHIPHVGALAIMEGAPGANALVEYVRKHVGLTECPWIDEAMRAEWKGVKTEGR